MISSHLRRRNRVSEDDAEALTVALAASPGSAAATRALARNQHRVLRDACASGDAEEISRILELYGAPGCAGVLPALAARNYAAMAAAFMSGDAAVVSPLLAAHGPPGCAAIARFLPKLWEAHAFRKWRWSPPSSATAEAVAAAYGPPGAPQTLANLASRKHAALRNAGSQRMVTALVRAYGGAGAPALREALASGVPSKRVGEGGVLYDVLYGMVYGPYVPDDEGWVALFDAFGAAPGSDAMLAVLAVRDHELLRHSPGGAMTKALVEAYGGPGCAAVVEGLRAGNHAALLAACAPLRTLAKLNALVEAYGGPGCAAVVEGLSAGNHAALLRSARDRATMDEGPTVFRRLVAALLAAYGAAAQEGLAAGGHAALLAACTTQFKQDPVCRPGERRQHLVVDALLAAYGGGPGSAAVLAALTAGDHAALRAAFMLEDDGRVVEALLEAYGGDAALLAALAATNAVALVSIFRHRTQQLIIDAYGQHGREALLAALQSVRMYQCRLAAGGAGGSAARDVAHHGDAPGARGYAQDLDRRRRECAREWSRSPVPREGRERRERRVRERERERGWQRRAPWRRPW